MNRFATKSIALILALAFMLVMFSPVATVSAEGAGDQEFLPSLADFSKSVENANSNLIAGIYVNNLMALPVVQQPSGQAGFVSTTGDVITQFAAASKYGSTGLLAHNYLAGQYFTSLSRGSIIALVNGDGTVQSYVVTVVKLYQALSPNNPYSQFINLAQPGVTLSSSDLFYQTYGLKSALVLQTCITKGSESSWGRLFVIAEPVQNIEINLKFTKNIESIYLIN